MMANKPLEIKLTNLSAVECSLTNRMVIGYAYTRSPMVLWAITSITSAGIFESLNLMVEQARL